MVTPARWPIRFDRWYAALSRLLLLPPSDAFVELAGGEVRVRMSWAFRARFPRAAVASAAAHQHRPLSRGVHGLAGRWLVNGSADGLVELRLSPAQRAYVLGFAVRLEMLLVSVEDPAAAIRALLGRTEGNRSP